MDLSCPDWEARLQAGRSLVPDLKLDRAAGARAVAIFNKLRLHDVPGTPTLAEAGGDWFRDIVFALFGSQDPTTRQRAIRELFLLVPKKNAKTTQGALLMLTALLLNERPNASLIMTAPVQDVAHLAFDAAAGAILLDPVLQQKLHIREHLKTIVHRETRAALQIMSFDPAALTGQKPVAVLIDELHVVAKMGKASSAIRQLRGGMLPFPEAFMAFITTQSEEPPSGVFRAELTKARAIRDGTQEGVMLPVLYEFPVHLQKGDGWRDSRNWAMVTPNAGRSISIPRLVEEMATAEATGDDELRAWASQHLNLEIGLSLGSGAWAGADVWEECGPQPLPLAELLERSEVVTIGIDGGGRYDLLGIAVMGREAETGRWLHWAHAWAQEVVLERQKAEAPKLRDFERDGDLTIIPLPGPDVRGVGDIVEQCERSGLLDQIGVDQAGIGAVVDEIVGRGIAFDRIVGIPQGWRLNSAIKTLERKLAEGAVLHGGSRLMNYAVGNARVEPRGNAILITREAAGNAKIDPLMATFNAAQLLMLNPQARAKTYEMFFVGGSRRDEPSPTRSTRP